MGKAEVLEKLKKAIEEMDVELAESAAREAVAEGVGVVEAIEEGLSKGMDTIGQLFDEGEVFVPQLLIAAEAFMNAVKILEEALPAGTEKTSKGRVLLCTVEGDIHDVGKNIVRTMLQANGFEVIDLGRDCATDYYVQQAVELKPDICAASALMTTTMPAQRDIARELKKAGVNAKTLFGGACVTKAWVEEIGGDAYAPNAGDAVNVAKELVGK